MALEAIKEKIKMLTGYSSTMGHSREIKWPKFLILKNLALVIVALEASRGEIQYFDGRNSTMDHSGDIKTLKSSF